jgi:CheY-like chemotaxis protein
LAQLTSLDGRRILVVDDDPRVRDSIVSLLRASGNLVDAMQSGSASQALLIADRVHPDLAVVDVNLPDLADGLSLIRTLSARSEIRVVAMSVNGSFEPQARTAGAVAFFDKGESADDVVALLVRLLPAPQGGDSHLSA